MLSSRPILMGEECLLSAVYQTRDSAWKHPAIPSSPVEPGLAFALDRACLERDNNEKKEESQGATAGHPLCHPGYICNAELNNPSQLLYCLPKTKRDNGSESLIKCNLGAISDHPRRIWQPLSSGFLAGAQAFSAKALLTCQAC